MAGTLKEQTLPIRDAAKRIGCSRALLHELIDSGRLIAYRFGGPDEHPWLRVEVQQAIEAVKLASIYTPSRPTQAMPRPVMVRLNKKLDPAAAAM
jgi:hypothetical protein